MLRDYKYFEYENLGRSGYAVVNMSPGDLFEEREIVESEILTFIKSSKLDILFLCFLFKDKTTPGLFRREFIAISAPERLAKIAESKPEQSLGIELAELLKPLETPHLYYKDPSCTVSRKNFEPFMSKV